MPEGPGGAILDAMKDGSKVPVPGQTMDVDLSEGEEPVVVPPKKKELRAEVSGSPSKRHAPEAEMVTLDVLKGLFKEQTQELKSSLRSELATAIQTSEEKMTGVVESAKKDLESRIQNGSKELGRVKDMQEMLMARVTALEQREVPNVSPMVAAARPPTVLFGGWKADTKRGVIVDDITRTLAKAGADDLVDQTPWVPRARHSICLSEMKLREAESERDREQRMLAIIAKVNDSKISTQKLASGNTLWATISRPKSDRGNGPHASKVRRLLHMISADFGEVGTRIC